MNLRKNFSALICLLLMAVSVNAVAAVRVWHNSAGEGFGNFYAAMQKNGWADERGISVSGISDVAYGYAEKAGLVENADKQIFIILFQKWNGLSGEFVSPEAFKAKGTGTGFWIGSLEEMKIPVTSKVTKTDTTDEILNLQEEIKKLSLKGGKSHEEVVILQSRLEALNAEVKARNEGNTKFKAEIQGTVNSMNQSIKSLKNEFGAMGSGLDERIQAKVDAGVQSLQGSIDAQNKSVDEAKGDAAAALKTAKGVVQKFDDVTEKVGRQGTATIVGFVLLFVAFILLAIKLWPVAKILRKHENTLFGIPGKNGGKGTPGLTSLSGRVLKLEEEDAATDKTFERLEGEIGDLKQSHEQLIDRVGRFFDEELIQPNKLKALPIGGRVEVALQHPHEEDNKIYLEVERSGEDKVTVHGAVRQSGQSAPLVIDSLAGVPSAINKAAKAGRIVGVLPTMIKPNPLRLAA